LPAKPARRSRCPATTSCNCYVPRSHRRSVTTAGAARQRIARPPTCTLQAVLLPLYVSVCTESTAPPERGCRGQRLFHTLTCCLLCVITAPQPHDARPYDQPRHALQDQQHPPSVQVPRRRLHAAQRWRFIDSPDLDGNELCAAPSYLRCALALPSPAPFRLARHPRSSPSTFTPQPLTLTLTAH